LDDVPNLAVLWALIDHMIERRSAPPERGDAPPGGAEIRRRDDIAEG
jgi:hypothetical protein